MLLKNKTHYFCEYTKCYNLVPDPSSFTVMENRRQSFYQRLYWEFEYVKKVHGYCFYVTFTYNNRAIPLYTVCEDGKNVHYPVFSYDHIRLITNGLLSKRLERDYGLHMKYFCACESGEGAGIRGEGNNPHYHFIFFVTPIPDVSHTFLPSSEFLEMCREVWQGKRGWSLWKYAKFGSVKPGKYGIDVQDSRALHYVSKYTTKSEAELAIETDLCEHFRSDIISGMFTYANVERYFNSLSTNYTREQLDFDLGLSRFETCKSYNPSYTLSDFVESLTDKPLINNWSSFKTWYINNVVPNLVSYRLSEFRNKYSGKPRSSKSLGEYGLQFVQNVETDPYFILHEKQGPKHVIPCLYYMRKLYYNVVVCPETQSVLYVLSPLGKKYKLNNLHIAISRYFRKTSENLSKMFTNEWKFWYKHDNFDTLAFGRELFHASDYMSVLYRYAVYHCVYQYRSYTSSTPVALTDKFVIDDIKTDYSLFLDHDYYWLDFDSGTVFNMFSADGSVLQFSNLPVFRKYLLIFEYLDAVNDNIGFMISDLKKKDFAEKSELLKKHAALRINIASGQ